MQLPDINTTVEEKILRELKTSNSPGPDGIHLRILKEFATELADPLASIESGQLPSYWKIAKVTPIFKKGNKKDPSGTSIFAKVTAWRCTGTDSQPVSLTSIVSKVLRDSMIDHLRVNNLLSNKQFGFLKHRSVNLQMITVLDEWTTCLDQGAPVDVVYLDFMKAFDKVSHDYLVQKLKSLGIHEKLLCWIRDFLKDRIVPHNGYISLVKVESGVPQGSVIGPASFVTFINDLPEAVSSNIFMFKGITSDVDRNFLQSYWCSFPSQGQ